MKKTIKRITLYCTILSVVALYFSNRNETIVVKNSLSNVSDVIETNQENSNEALQTNGFGNEVYAYHKVEFSNNKANASNVAPSTASPINLSSSENSKDEVPNGEDVVFKDIVASNYSSQNSFSNYSTNEFSNNSSGPNANINESVSAESAVGNADVAATNSYSSESTASRVSPSNVTPNASRSSFQANNSGLSINVSSNSAVLVESGPPGPGGGGDPFVPIDDYYGLFALLLCAGVVFWYRNKTNKLVGVKVYN